MPIKHPTYRPPFLFSNPNLQTIFASSYRLLPTPAYARERLELPDGDFLDIDWVRRGHRRCVITTHGLEGNSHRSYMRGMARAAAREGWDVAAVNLRGCSGEPNRLLRSYHHGVSDDLRMVVDHVAAMDRYRTLALVGFSLGGNVTMKYLGEDPDAVASKVVCAVAVSTPFHLASCADKLAEPRNKIYFRRFLRMLHEKVSAKMKMFPGQLDDTGFFDIPDFKTHDDRYIAPLHGFRDAEDYWQKAASGQFLKNVRVPSFIISALDDPFLTDRCFPRVETQRNKNLVLELPRHGGHVGFVTFARGGDYYHERRACEFLRRHGGG